MALIDVDRHILAQIASLQTKIKMTSAKYFVEWNKIIEVRDKTEALFTPPSKGNPEDFKKLRNGIFRATKQCAKYANEISACTYKTDALLQHLITEIDMVDTRKGQETRSD